MLSIKLHGLSACFVIASHQHPNPPGSLKQSGTRVGTRVGTRIGTRVGTRVGTSRVGLEWGLEWD